MAEFSQTIGRLNDGHAETELSLQLKQLISTVHRDGKTGKLTVEVTVTRDKKFENLLTMTATSKLTMPKQEPRETAFTIRPDGSIVGMEELQRPLEFGAAPGLGTAPAAIIQFPTVTEGTEAFD